MANGLAIAFLLVFIPKGQPPVLYAAPSSESVKAACEVGVTDFNENCVIQ